jgi:hypothetical protein
VNERAGASHKKIQQSSMITRMRKLVTAMIIAKRE